nr:putative carbonic anhydrase b-CA(1)-2 [Streptomyces sp.]
MRSAGEVLDEAVLGSITFGVLELGIPLVVILGHQSCGAVSAAVRAADGGAPLPGHMHAVPGRSDQARDRPQAPGGRADRRGHHRERAPGAVAAGRGTDLAAKVAAGELAVVGARYELTNQRVRRIR